MLKNIPTSESLEQVSLRRYFTAWVHVKDIFLDFLHVEAGDDTREKDEFLARAQPDLQLSYTLIQQSQEIALKAKICAVSPFLLLSGLGMHNGPKSDADFAECRTLDASDLVKVINTICAQGISDQFEKRYKEIGSGRNKINHLGTHNDILDPRVLLNTLVMHYEQLYQGRVWFRERLNYENQTRGSMFTSTLNKKTTIGENKKTTIGDFLILFDEITNEQHLSLFGFSKEIRRYICHDCEPEWLFSPGKTATLVVGKDAVFCHLCEKEFPVRRDRCLNILCNSNVISSDENYVDRCHLCGKGQKDLPRDDNVIRLRRVRRHRAS